MVCILVHLDPAVVVPSTVQGFPPAIDAAVENLPSTSSRRSRACEVSNVANIAACGIS